LQALIDIKKTGNALLKKVKLKDIKPITIIETSYDKIKPHIRQPQGSDDDDEYPQQSLTPSEIFVHKYSIEDQNDPNLEKATSDLYNLEFYSGKMNAKTSLPGTLIPSAKEKIKQTLLKLNKSSIFYELTNQPVFCRCGSACYVKILNNQWFLNYGNKEWKTLARKCLHQMDIIPNEIIGEFENVFEWLRERACARKSGLGTALPWDKDWTIESLSDSVIYMAYYIIAKYVNTKDLENYDSLIDESFFDYVLYSKKSKNFRRIGDDGSVVFSGDHYEESLEKHVEKKDLAFLKSFLKLSYEIKREFEYYYPLDSRHSGRDLIPNHLSFFVFNHAILFAQNHWPKQIVVNGSVLMDGKKMSKSMGNIIPLRRAIKQFSADSIRVAMLVLGELLQDVDFSSSVLKGIFTKLNDFYKFYIAFYEDNKTRIGNMDKDDSTSHVLEVEPNDLGLEDRWLFWRVKHHVKEISNSFDRMKIREALNIALYLMDKDFEWYRKRKLAKAGNLCQNKKEVHIIYHYLSKRNKLLSPFCPFLSEELWHVSGNSHSIFNSSWPITENKTKSDDICEENEVFISNMLVDINKIIRVTKSTSISKVFIYLSSEEKNLLYNEILTMLVTHNISKNFGEVMKMLLSGSNDDVEKQNIIKKNTDFIKKTVDDILSLTPVDRERRISIGMFDEFEPIHDAVSLLSSEYKIPPENILIYRERQKGIVDPGNKARFSRPFKPAIFIQ
jgi:leucyl-tRNA synthetase